MDFSAAMGWSLPVVTMNVGGYPGPTIGGRLRKNRRPRGLFLMVLAWVVIALFLAMLFVFEPQGMVGLGQRIFLAAMLTWLLITASGLGSGTFTVARNGRA